MQHKVTQKHFEEFKRHVWRWVEIFGLTDWKLIVVHEKLDKDYRLATFNGDNEARSAKISINTTWAHHAPTTPENIRKAAIHEVCHMLLNDMYDLSICRFGMRAEVDLTEEKVVVRLENVLSKLCKE